MVMAYFPAALEKLIDQFASLPGIGRKSAQRLAFFVLAQPEENAEGTESPEEQDDAGDSGTETEENGEEAEAPETDAQETESQDAETAPLDVSEQT